MVKIVYTRWNLANKFDDCIELNEGLKKYPKLHGAILRHELEHSDKYFSTRDLSHDILPTKKVKQSEILSFMLRHPKSFSQLLPLYYSPRRKEFIYDLNLIIIYSFMIGVAGLGIYLGLRFT